MKEKHIKLTIISLVCLLIFSFLNFNFSAIFQRGEPVVHFLDEWYYSEKGENKGNITLPAKLETDKKGTTEISTVLPQDFNGDCHVCFWTFYRSVSVYLDGKLIYDYNNAAHNNSFGKASSSKWNFVQIKDSDAASKVLTIKMHTPYSDVSGRLTEVVYGEWDEIYSWLEGSYGIFSIIDTVVFWTGIVFMVLAFVNTIKKHYNRNQAYAGLLLVLLSIYMRTGTKSFPISWMSHYMRELLCFTSLLLLTLPFMLYIKSRIPDKPRMTLWCNIVLICHLVTVNVLFILHGFGVADLHRMMPLGYIWLLITIITALVFSVALYIRERSKILPFNVMSLVIMIAMFFVEYIQFYCLDGIALDTGVFSHIAALAIILIEFGTYVYLLKGEDRNTSLVEKENENLRVQMLTTQIRPHFILNTIGAIRTLIKEDGDRASSLLYDFSKYIRQNLEQKDYSKPVPFLEELDYIETYLSLERARFGDVIKVEYDIKIKNFWVLPLTIQPFVENSVKHGLSTSESGGIITIKTRDMDSYVQVEIKDNGVGFDAAELKRKLETQNSIGLRSAITRLEKEMGCTVSISSSTNPRRSGTTIRIEIPKK